MKAFTGMNQTCCVSAKRVSQAGLAVRPSDSQSAIRRPSNVSAKCGVARGPGSAPSRPGTCLRDRPPLLTFPSPASGRTNGGLRKLGTETAAGCACELSPAGARPGCLVCASCPPQTAEPGARAEGNQAELEHPHPPRGLIPTQPPGNPTPPRKQLPGKCPSSWTAGTEGR